MSDDLELIRRYVRDRDEQAFETVLRRYLNLVYSAALRIVGDSHLAHDITQTVFVKLARNAAALPNIAFLGGWLYADTRLTALQFLRSESRRSQREISAMGNHIQTTVPDPDWTAIRPVLDDALDDLAPTERDAILLRFFGERSFNEIAQTLQLAPDAARMRVNRALEKLREALARRGLNTTAAALSAALLAHSVQAAPPALAGAIVGGVRALSGSSALTVTRTSSMVRARYAAGVLICAIAVFVWHTTRTPRFDLQPLQTGANSAPPQAPLINPPPLSAPGSQAQNVKSLRLKVVEEGTTTPLGGVSVHVSTFTDLLNWASRSLVTDPDGAVQIEYPLQAQHDFFFRFRLEKDGFVARYVSWSRFQNDEIEQIPAEYQASMARGVTIGGFVRSSAGEPIPNVALIFSGDGPVGVDPRERDTVMGVYHTERTDAAGRWTCNHVRAAFETLTFRLEHPAFQSVTYGCLGTRNPALNGVIRLPDAEYRAGTANMTMQSGLQLSGMVLETNGAALSGAVVTLNRQWRTESATVNSGSSGEFTIGSAQPGAVTVSVAASGFAPATQSLTVTSSLSGLRFELARSKGGRGRVVDEAGLPIEKAELEFEQDGWFKRIYDWKVRTDQLGSFFWDSSPNEPFRASVFASGYQSTNILLTPGNDDQVIVLNSLPSPDRVTLTGTVLDAVDAQPVPNLQVYLYESQYGDVPAHHVADGTNGAFSLKLPKSKSGYRLEVRAAGYQPAQSRDFDTKSDVEPFSFALQKGGDITALILGPDGKPVEGAEVALCAGEQGATLGHRKFLFPEQSNITRTDASGRFTHQRRVGAHHLYAVHDLGYAEVRLKTWDNGPLQLQPWSRVEGRLTVAGQPMTGEHIAVNALFEHGLERMITLFGIEATTEADGRFTIEDLPSIEVRLSWGRPIGQPGRGRMSTHPLKVALAPGVTAQVDYAINGMTATGKLVWAGEGEINWPEQGRCILHTTLGLKPWEDTPGYAEATPEQRRAIEFEFPYTEAGHASFRAQRSEMAELQPDGHFTATFLQPGVYFLWVTVREKTDNSPSRFPFGRIIAHFQQRVTIPSDVDTFDLGEFQITASKKAMRP